MTEVLNTVRSNSVKRGEEVAWTKACIISLVSSTMLTLLVIPALYKWFAIDEI